jgi:hypothetical protein
MFGVRRGRVFLRRYVPALWASAAIGLDAESFHRTAFIRGGDGIAALDRAAFHTAPHLVRRRAADRVEHDRPARPAWDGFDERGLHITIIGSTRRCLK